MFCAASFTHDCVSSSIVPPEGLTKHGRQIGGGLDWQCERYWGQTSDKLENLCQKSHMSMYNPASSCADNTMGDAGAGGACVCERESMFEGGVRAGWPHQATPLQQVASFLGSGSWMSTQLQKTRQTLEYQFNIYSFTQAASFKALWHLLSSQHLAMMLAGEFVTFAEQRRCILHVESKREKKERQERSRLLSCGCSRKLNHSAGHVLPSWVRE